MAAVRSLKDGYANEVGVFSAAVSSTTSVLIGHTIMLPSNVNTAFKSVGYTSSVNTQGATTIGGLYAADGAIGTLTITNAGASLRLSKVGGVIQQAGANSLPQGQI